MSNECVLVLTGCLQAQILSDFFVVTWVSEVKDAVAGELHLKNGISQVNVNL